jgi:hypothetical protein
MASTRETVKLCSAQKDAHNPSSPRCILPSGHDPKVPHQGIGPNGKPIQWPVTAP